MKAALLVAALGAVRGDDVTVLTDENFESSTQAGAPPKFITHAAVREPGAGPGDTSGQPTAHGPAFGDDKATNHDAGDVAGYSDALWEEHEQGRAEVSQGGSVNEKLSRKKKNSAIPV